MHCLQHDDAVTEATYDAFVTVLGGRASATGGCKPAATLFTLARGTSACIGGHASAPLPLHARHARDGGTRMRGMSCALVPPLPPLLPQTARCCSSCMTKATKWPRTPSPTKRRVERKKYLRDVQTRSTLPAPWKPWDSRSGIPQPCPAMSPLPRLCRPRCCHLIPRRCPLPAQMNGWGREEVDVEVAGGRASLASKCGMPEGSIRGFRQPFLQASATVREVGARWSGMVGPTCHVQRAG